MLYNSSTSIFKLTPAGVIELEILLELPPYSRNRVEKTVSATNSLLDGYFIPCAPAGVPMMDCFATGVYVTTKYGSEVYCSLRTRDYTLNHILEKVKVASEFGLSGVLVTRGDPPRHGSDCNDYTTEFVVSYIRKHGLRADLGIVLSTKFTVEEMVKRVECVKPDFVTIIRFSGSYVECLRALARAFSGIKKTFAFILLGLGNNVELFERLGQPYVLPGELEAVIERLRGLVTGIILSSPLELYGVVETVKRVKRLAL
ncbi:MAG: hypothetical protein QXY82_06665 [Desulfurococcaceae archaeon]